ncbi:MAG: PAS domain S-box protein [Methanoregula sp.]
MISVLCVDDEPVALELCKRYLEKTDEFSVTTAPSASVAFDILKTNGIQAIVSDYRMPEMNGIEFLKHVRATHKHLPFIIFTGKGWDTIAIQAFENGADFYLQKESEKSPKATYANLMHKIRAAVEHRKADAEVITVNQLYSVLSATNKAIVHIHDKKRLLNEICRIVVDTGGFSMAWAGIANTKTHRIDPVGSSGPTEGFLDTIAISTDDIPKGRGPTGTAFRTGKFKVCNDIEHDPKMAPWRNEALERGYHSLASFPFAHDTKNAGVLTVYAPEPGFFTDRIVRLLDEQSGDISFALQALDHEEKRIAVEGDLKKSELQYRRLFETAQDAILILDGDCGEIIDANRFILDMLGYPLDYFTGKHLWELGFIADKSIAQNAFIELNKNGYVRYEDLPLERKDGQRMDVEFISNAYFVGNKKIIQCNIRDITERKQAEVEKERTSREIYDLYNNAPCGYHSLDKDGVYININETELSWLGYSREEIIKRKKFSDFITKESREVFSKAFPVFKEKGWMRDLEFDIIRKDGSIITVLASAIAIKNPDGSLVGSRSTLFDITGRKRAEAAARLHSEIVQNMAEGVALVNARDSRIVYANPRFESMFGYTTGELIGRPFSSINAPGEKGALTVADTIITSLKQNGIWSGELLNTRKDGATLWSSANVSTFHHPAYGPVWIWVQMDITERKHVELELESAMQRLEAAHRIAHIGTWNWEMETDTVTWSDEMYNIAGRDVSLPAPTYAEHPQIYSPASWERLSSAVTRTLKNGEPYILELEIIRPDGSTRWVNAYGDVNRDENKKVTGLHGMIQDITVHYAAAELTKAFGENLEREVARKTSDLTDVNQRLLVEIGIRIDAEKQLTQSVGQKEILIREVHHRVKNNLQIIISLLNLQSRYMTDEKTLAAFKESQNRVRAMALVHEKLYQSADLATIDLDNYLRFLGDNLFQFLGMSGKGITLNMDIRDIFLPIDTAIPMGLIINELISNSLKYAFPLGRTGEISIAIHRQDTTLSIRFKDNGIGIPEDFNWRNAESLGLRLVCSLVEQLDGTIELDRSSGTAFTIVVEEKE